MSLLFDGYWPWWLGAPAFLILVGGMWLIERRLLGVSGIFNRALIKETASEREFRLESIEKPDAIEDAMLRATLEEFGPEAVEEFLKEMAEKGEDVAPEQPAAALVPVPQGVNVAFLVMLLVGGALGAMGSGTWEIRNTLGYLHTTLMHGETNGLILLVMGGILVGFGTRMSGGCTSGHGLSGCSRLEPASLLATVCFFGTATAVSFLLRALV